MKKNCNNCKHETVGHMCGLEQTSKIVLWAYENDVYDGVRCPDKADGCPGWEPATEIDAPVYAFVNLVDHPAHYGGADNPYEAIKVIEAWGLDFCLGNVVKYISRAGKKSDKIVEDLEKAQWYLQRRIQQLKGK